MTWLAFDVPFGGQLVHAVVSQNVRYAKHYSLMTDAQEISRLDRLFRNIQKLIPEQDSQDPPSGIGVKKSSRSLYAADEPRVTIASKISKVVILS